MAPFADIVLLSFNSATAIVIQIILAIVFLNEVFICKYDLPALALIISGSICIILTANFTEHDGSVAKHKENLSDIRSVCFFACVGVLIYLTICLLKRMRRNLATFERETDQWFAKEKQNDDSINDVHNQQSRTQSNQNEEQAANSARNGVAQAGAGG